MRCSTSVKCCKASNLLNLAISMDYVGRGCLSCTSTINWGYCRTPETTCSSVKFLPKLSMWSCSSFGTASGRQRERSLITFSKTTSTATTSNRSSTFVAIYQNCCLCGWNTTTFLLLRCSLSRALLWSSSRRCVLVKILSGCIEGRWRMVCNSSEKKCSCCRVRSNSRIPW